MFSKKRSSFSLFPTEFNFNTVYNSVPIAEISSERNFLFFPFFLPVIVTRSWRFYCESLIRFKSLFKLIPSSDIGLTAVSTIKSDNQESYFIWILELNFRFSWWVYYSPCNVQTFHSSIFVIWFLVFMENWVEENTFNTHNLTDILIHSNWHLDGLRFKGIGIINHSFLIKIPVTKRANKDG